MRQTNKTGGTVLGTLVRGVLALMLGMGLLCAHATPARALSAPADKPAATRGKPG